MPYVNPWQRDCGYWVKLSLICRFKISVLKHVKLEVFSGQ